MEPLPTLDAEILARLDRFIRPVLHDAVTGRQRRTLARTYVRGLLGSSDRKNVEQIVRTERGVSAAPAHERRTTGMMRDDDWRHEVVMWDGAHRLFEQSDGWCAYTLDDTALLKQGSDSVGVKAQYAGCVGRTANCQVLVTVGVAQEHASAPLAAQLFLPESWADDDARRVACSVPAHIRFETKTAIALGFVRRIDLDGMPHYPVLADSAYGNVAAFRAALTARGFPWVVGLGVDTTVWPAGLKFEPIPRRAGAGRPAVRLRPTTPTAPQTVTKFAKALSAEAWQRVCWREGSRGPQKARFAAVRVRPAHGWDNCGIGQDELCDEAWLLLHWPEDKQAPTKAWLASLPADTPISKLVGFARLRWRVERDYREGKGLAGLDHYEGRTWHGLHHHAALVVLAQQFLATERVAALSAAAASEASAVDSPTAFPP